MSVRRWMRAEALHAEDADRAFTFCRKLARSRLLPTAECLGWADRYVGVPLMPGLVARPLRRHVAALCAFSRLLSEIPRDDEGRAVLAGWHSQFAREDCPGARHPILLALSTSARELDLPRQPYEDLLRMSEQDCVKHRYKTEAEAAEYCSKSASPLGRIILMIHGYRDPEILRLSDDLFTAFHFTNIMRNLKSDLQRDRIYLPEEDFERFGYTEADLRMGIVNERFRNLIKSRWKKTRALYESSKPLIRKLHWPLSWQFKMKWLRGNLLLRKIRRYGFDTLHERPQLKNWDWPRLLGGLVLP